MKSIKFALSLAFLYLASALCLVNAADQPQSSTQSVKLSIDIVSVISGTANISKGNLSFQGKQYPFTVTGLRLRNNALGSAKVKVSGNAEGLTDLSNFSGTYIKVDGKILPGVGGAIVLKNQNGVILRLSGETNEYAEADSLIFKLTQ